MHNRTLENIINKRISFRKFLVITVYFKSKEKISDTVFLFEKKGSRLEITKETEEFISERNKLTLKEMKGLPLYIHFSGAGVMTREAQNHITNDSIQNFMPGFQAKDYIVQVNNLQNENSIINITRKDQVALFLDKLKKIDVYPAGIFLSLYPIVPLAGNFGKTDNKKIDLGDHCLLIDNGVVTGVGKGIPSDSILFMEQKRDLKTTYALSCAIKASISPYSHISNIDALSEGYSNAAYSTIGNQFLKYGLAVLFLVLFINYLCFDHLQKKHNTLTLQIETRENMLESLSLLKIDLNNKMTFISENGLKNSIHPSYISDQIGILVPEGINLTEMTINPLQRKIKANESIHFNNGKLEIKGLSKSVESYREFISNVEKAKWCEEISYQDYSYEPGNKTAQIQLHIIIKTGSNDFVK